MRILLIFAIILTVSDPVLANDFTKFFSEKVCQELPQTDSRAEEFAKVAGKSFAELIRKESPKTWYDCGSKTPLEDWDSRGIYLAKSTLLSMYSNKLCVDPLGVLSVAFNESRGNACSIGPRARKAAIKGGFLPSKKDWRTYTREELLSVLNNPKWVSRGYVADVGVYQDIYPRYARILDEKGDMSCLGSRHERCRIPRVEELVEVSSSAEIGIHGMLNRYYHFRTREPWIYWPWTVRESYSKAVRYTLERMRKTFKKMS